MKRNQRSTTGNHRNWVEISAAVCAVAISAASLFIAVRQSTLMERQLSASTWPVLEYDTSNIDEQGNPEVALQIKNAGLGPARIRSFAISYNGNAIANSRQLIDACCAGGEKPPRLDLISSTVNHSVLTANEQVRFLRFKSTPENLVYWNRLNTERFKIAIRSCYCSALDECWVLDSSKDEQEHVETCTSTQDVQFTG